MPSSILGIKHKTALYWSTSLDSEYNNKYVIVAVDDIILDGVGGLIYSLGAQYPGNDTLHNKVNYNSEVTQRLMWLGLELMGAHGLEFTGSVTVSPDSEAHVIWTENGTIAGNWNIEIQLPPQESGINPITSINVTSLECGEEPTASLDAGVLSLGIPVGCNGSDGIDGSNGIDGITPHLRVNSGYIQWSIDFPDYTSWTNLIAITDITGPQGEQGVPGNDGTDGSNGSNGTDGTNGTNGIDGINAITVPSEPEHAIDFNGQICAISQGIIKYVMDTYDDLLDKAIAEDDLGELNSYGWLKIVGLIPILGNAIDYYHGLTVLAASTGLAVSKAQDTTEFRDAASCVVYCILKTANTTLITEDIFNDIISGVAALPHDEIEKVNTLFGMLMNSIGYSVLGSRATLFANDSSSDCEAICEDCAEVGATITFTLNAGVLPTSTTLSIGQSTDWIIPILPAAGEVYADISPNTPCTLEITANDGTGIAFNPVNRISDITTWSNPDNYIGVLPSSARFLYCDGYAASARTVTIKLISVP